MGHRRVTPYWPDDNRVLMFRPEVGAEESPLWDPAGSLYFPDRHFGFDAEFRARLQDWTERASLENSPELTEEGRALFEEVQRRLPQATVIWDALG